jgi:hypothetical protein
VERCAAPSNLSAGHTTNTLTRAIVESDRNNLSVDALKRSFLEHLYYTVGKYPAVRKWT